MKKHIKKYKKKKAIKKHYSKKRRQKKQFNIWIFLIAIIIVFLMLLFLNKEQIEPSKKTEIPEKKAVIENITFNNIPDSDRSLFSFFVRNDYDEPADCSVTIFLNNKNLSKNLGIIKPKSRKLSEDVIYMSDSKAGIKIKTDCQWDNEIDISGCENSTFRVCNTVRNNENLKQCLNKDIPMQYFCIAFITKDVTYCNEIKLLPRKTLCKVFLENKPGLCENLKEWRDWCYQDYGMNKKDKESCEKIKNEDKKNACLAVITRNLELCKNINEEDKFRCIVHLAEITRNKALCDLLVDKESCYKELEWMK